MPSKPGRVASRIRYHEVADQIRSQIERGDFGESRVLPAESDIAAAHDVSRVTARKALEMLREEDLVESRRGAGWFVRGTPFRQHLGRLGTIESQLERDGRSSQRRILDFAVTQVPPEVKQVLKVDEALRVDRVNLADGLIFSRVTVWCPIDLAIGITREHVTDSSFLELLDVQFAGATQTIEAKAASNADAKVLEVSVGSPVMACRRVTFDVDGRAVLMAEHVFAGDRSAFVIDLPQPGDALAPTGLRLRDAETSPSR